MEELLSDIINCENIKICRKNKSHPCAKINKLQGDNLDTFSLPEPWNGNLNSKVLFISSNPSIDDEEEFPKRTWEKSEIFDFFINRFKGTKKAWVKNDKYILLKNGEYRDSNVKFWASVGARSKEIYEGKNIIYGQDFCITEIVKCKSKNEIGVKEAYQECSDKYLSRLLGVSKAKVIVVLGAIAKKNFIQKYIPDSDDAVYLEDVLIENKQRDVIFLPHPSSFEKKKTIKGCIGTDNLKRVKARINH